MPRGNTHCAISKKRTGFDFKELHKWIDENQKEDGLTTAEKGAITMKMTRKQSKSIGIRRKEKDGERKLLSNGYFI